MHSLVLEQIRPRPVYMTHRQQAAMGEPVGDPFAGAAFGQRRGPAIAVFGAFSSISAGLAAGGLLGGLMIAGGVMSGLGAITGNKTLSGLGMLAGLAGGVGQFVQQGGFDSFSQAYQADGMQGVADQFTGAADYGYNPGQVMDGAISQAAPSVAQNIIPKIDAQSIMSAGGGDPFGSAAQSSNMSSLGVEFPAGSVAPSIEAGANASGGLLNSPIGESLSANASQAGGGGVMDGLTGLWKGSGDFTKMSIINAGAGALKGMSEADANDKLLEMKKSQVESGNKLTEAQAAAIDKKNAGVQTVGIGSFGTNRSAAFGKNADGTARSYAEYISDRTEAARRLFGQTQPA
jgi:hypothetical protein